jgi:hypothetical protein
MAAKSEFMDIFGFDTIAGGTINKPVGMFIKTHSIL